MNLNLAIAAAATGNLSGMTASFAGFLERFIPDRRENARKIFGCRGVLSDLY